MHIACSGFTSVQRAISNSLKEKDKVELELAGTTAASKASGNKRFIDNQAPVSYFQEIFFKQKSK